MIARHDVTQINNSLEMLASGEAIILEIINFHTKWSVRPEVGMS